MDQQFIELFDVSRVVYDPVYLPDWPETTVRWSRSVITTSSSSSGGGGGSEGSSSSTAASPPPQPPPQTAHTLPPRDGPDPLRTPSPMVAAS